MPPVPNPPRRRKCLTQEQKVDVIKRKERGERNCNIAKHFKVNESTIHTILSKKEAILQAARAFGSARMDERVRVSDPAVVMMERYLLLYCNRKEREGVPIDSLNIRQQARHLYGLACRKLGKGLGHFKASTGWFAKFKKRKELRRVQVIGERASADVAAGDSFPAVLKEIITEGGYTPEQIYNIDETGLRYKKMPKSTYIAKHHRQGRGRNVDKVSITILFTCNLAGHKMRPFFVSKVKKPRCYKHLKDMNESGVYWEKSNTGWMTRMILNDWFKNHFIPDAKARCAALGIPFKVMLVLDNAPGHPAYLDGLHPAVKVIFLPANTTSLIQPLDQEVITNFKYNYETIMFNHLRNATDNHEEERLMEAEDQADQEAEGSSDDDLPNPQPGPSRDPQPVEEEEEPVDASLVTVAAFWRRYNMQNVVTNVLQAWGKVTLATINHAWRKLTPHLCTGSGDEAQSVAAAREEAVKACRQLPGCEEVQEEELEEVVGNNTTPEEAVERITQMDNELIEDDNEPAQIPAQAQEMVMTMTRLNNILAGAEVLKEAIQVYEVDELRRDENLEAIIRVMRSYEEMRQEKIQQRHQTLLTRYFPPQQQQQQQHQQQDQEEDAMSDISADFEGFVQEAENWQRAQDMSQDSSSDSSDSQEPARQEARAGDQ